MTWRKAASSKRRRASSVGLLFSAQSRYSTAPATGPMQSICEPERAAAVAVLTAVLACGSRWRQRRQAPVVDHCGVIGGLDAICLASVDSAHRLGSWLAPHRSRVPTATSNALRQATRYSANMKSGVFDPSRRSAC